MSASPTNTTPQSPATGVQQTGTSQTDKEGPKEASKTFLEQIKLLITLASTFIVAPAVLFKDLDGINSMLLISMELLFIGSVFCGYVAVGSIAGTQFQGDYNIYRRASMYSSLAQIATYLLGMFLFTIGFLQRSNEQPKSAESQKVVGRLNFNQVDTLQVRIVERSTIKNPPVSKQEAKKQVSPLKPVINKKDSSKRG